MVGNGISNDNGDGSQINHLHVQHFQETEAKRSLALRTLPMEPRKCFASARSSGKPGPKDSRVLPAAPWGPVR